MPYAGSISTMPVAKHQTSEVRNPSSACSNGKIILPLLRSLTKRHHTYSDNTLTHEHIHTTLKQYHAQKKICSFILYHYKRNMSSKIKANSGEKVLSQDGSKAFRTSSQIIHSLLYSPTLAIRQSISCLLLEATHPQIISDSTSTAASTSTSEGGDTKLPINPHHEYRDLLFEMLWDIVQHDMKSILSSSRARCDSDSDMHGLIQVYGILTHLICDSDIYITNNIESEEGVDKDKRPLSENNGVEKKKTDEGTKQLCGIAFFVARGGLRWVTSSILGLVCLMMDCDQKSPRLNDIGICTPLMSNLQWMESIQTRLMLLIDFCHRLTMFGILHPTYDKQQQNVRPHSSGTGAKRNKSPSVSRVSSTRKKPRKLKRKHHTVSKSKSKEDQRKQLHSLLSFTNSKSTHLEEKRYSDREYILRKVHHLLWTSRIPCSYSSPHRINDSVTIPRTSPLSPLACLIASTKVLECISMQLSTPQAPPTTRDLPFHHAAAAALLSSSGIVSISSSSNSGVGGTNSGAGAGMKKEYGPMTSSDYPILPNRLRGMEKTLTLLQKMIDVSGNVTVVALHPSSSSTSVSSNPGGKSKADDEDEETEEGVTSRENELGSKRSKPTRSFMSHRPEVEGSIMDEDASLKRRTASLLSMEMNSRKRRKSNPDGQGQHNRNEHEKSSRVGDSSQAEECLDTRRYTSAAEVAAVLGSANISDPLSFLERQRIRTEGSGKASSGDDDVDELLEDALRMRDSDDDEEDGQDDMEADEDCFDVCFDECGDDGLIDGNPCEEPDEGHEVESVMMIDENGEEGESQMDTLPSIEVSKTTVQPSEKKSPTKTGQNSNAFIRASMEVLSAQHPSSYHDTMSVKVRDPSMVIVSPPLITPYAEQSLIQTLCDIVKPPKKPTKLRIFMKRAPTQEEFFRGSLSKNPITLSALKEYSTQDNNENGNGEDYEPRVKDLRQFIANDLQMSDSAELLELIVANKILDMNLKLRVVNQVLWKKYVLENSHPDSGRSTGRHIISTGTGLSMIFGIGEREVESSTGRKSKSSSITRLPPMAVTYRLAGVDGEATEDNVEEGDLIDPEAPRDISTSTEDYEKQLEKEYGLTRNIGKDRGVQILLKSLESYIGSIMQRIRRDDVGLRNGMKNPSRSFFLKSPPCPALILLRHCARLRENRKRLLIAQAPTILLRILLDVLNSIDKPSATDKKKHSHVGNNPTADAIQDLIETLSSDISSLGVRSAGKGEEMNDISSSDADAEGQNALPILLTSLQTTSLSQPLRKVIAKLLPFLTYGQLPQSRALATNFIRHINVDYLSKNQPKDEDESGSMLTETFIEAAIDLPPISVCDKLRNELLRQGFITDIKKFLLHDIPSSPPPWSHALMGSNAKNNHCNRNDYLEDWRKYYGRHGLQTAFRILIGLCTEHEATQSSIAEINCDEMGGSLTKDMNITTLTLLHWIESTSDNTSLDIETNGLGILAETLLDTLLQGNDSVEQRISLLRKDTRNRKKQIAEEKRRNTLMRMQTSMLKNVSGPKYEHENTTSIRIASERHTSSASNVPSSNVEKADPKHAKPSWMLEMEEMEDEEGLTCSVCQEGQTLQPTQMLGLYAYIKKISILPNQGGQRSNIDGTLLFVCLPSQLPESMIGTEIDDRWFQPAKRLSETLKHTSQGASATSSSPRLSSYITTVTAGNAIHYSCHARARAADRNHQKAPKSEWEGACLRNSRVACNVIFPLVSKSSTVSMMSVETALADYQIAMTNMLGSRPKSMLWTILHDIRILLLRISYGESLSLDCDGGSLTSNAALVFYSLFMADILARDAEHDDADSVNHAKELSSAFLATSEMMKADDLKGVLPKKLLEGYADAAPMAAISCILFHHKVNDYIMGTADELTVSSGEPKKRWDLYKKLFLHGLLHCAGRRHALGIEGSGYEPSRGVGGKRLRSSSFLEWKTSNEDESHVERSSLDVYATSLRPMITLYAIIDQISKEFSLSMNDEMVTNSAARVVEKVESLQRATDIRSLIALANIGISEDKIMLAMEAGLGTI